MDSLDQDTFVVKNREAGSLDKSQFKKTNSCLSYDEVEKVKKIRGLDEIDDLLNENLPKSGVEHKSLRRSSQITRSYSNKKRNVWLKAFLIGGGISILIISYMIYAYIRITRM